MPTFAVNVTEANAERDGQAARYIVDQENERRAALDPPGDPLPTTPAGELLTSYETCLAQTLESAHESYALQAVSNAAEATEAKERWVISSDAQRIASLNELEPLPAE